MILIGRYASPFTRRVAVAMRLYGIAYTHAPRSASGEPDAVVPFNPLIRVPTLVLDSGESLFESAAILDHLDALAGTDSALIPAAGPARRAVLRASALATGICDKLVSLINERMYHEATSAALVARWENQVRSAVAALEAERAASALPWWTGERLSHADVAITCMVGFLDTAAPALCPHAERPALVDLARRCEELDAFRLTVPA